MEDISKILAFEVKKELADRYFGFRRVIEEDSASYSKRILASAVDLEEKIGADLIRIYTLLQDTTLIQEFLQLAGLKEKLFFDDYVHSTPQKTKKIFSCQLVRGLTRKARIRNCMLDNYTSLHEQIIEYNTNIDALSQEHHAIREQINLFYKQNDLTGMMQFIRNLDTAQNSGMSEASSMQYPEGQSFKNMEDKMRLQAPAPVEELLPELPEIPSPKSVKKALVKLADHSSRLNPAMDPRSLCL